VKEKITLREEKETCQGGIREGCVNSKMGKNKANDAQAKSVQGKGHRRMVKSSPKKRKYRKGGKGTKTPQSGNKSETHGKRKKTTELNGQGTGKKENTSGRVGFTTNKKKSLHKGGGVSHQPSSPGI